MEHHGVDVHASSSSSTTSQSPTNCGKGAKLCAVCGDIAKSLHFGGLSCDSCKAFFRRSVHKDAYLSFNCSYESNCSITKGTRKGCQRCRFDKCIRIGMEKKWVMSEEERRRKMAKRGTASGGKKKGAGDTSPYVPNLEDMPSQMSEEEQGQIRSVCELYRLSYIKIPYTVPINSDGAQRSSVQVIGMFTTILRRFAYFAKLLPKFVELTKEDQGALLKGSVLEMVMLRGALSFDVENNQWPNTNLEFLANCPQLRVEDMENLVSEELFEMHMRFIQRVQRLRVDEPTTMLLLLIVLFYPERAGVQLQNVPQVNKAQELYSDLLRKYVNWRYGPEGAKLYPKLLSQLSDLRQLNDLHTEYHLNLAETEVNVIRQDLSQLDLDPYPQWKIVAPDAVDAGYSGGVEEEGSSPKFPPPLSPTPPPTSHSRFSRSMSGMREAFLRRIPQLIEDPFGPLITPEEIMRFAGASSSFIPPTAGSGGEMDMAGLISQFQQYQAHN